jgi:hypothetical protein
MRGSITLSTALVGIERDHLMRSRLQIAAASLIVIGALVAPASVAADTTGGGGAGNFGTITITIGKTATLQAHLIVNVPVTVTCTPPVDAVSVDGTFDAVQVMQAVGKGVATASGYSTNVACDGVAHTYLTAAVATTVPFHGGSAVASASASVCGTLADYTYACTDVSTPWVTIKVQG